MDKATTRRKKQTSPAARPPATLDDVPDHLLERVILRLDSHVSLLRAAAVCRRWRRVAACFRVLNHRYFFSRRPGTHVLGHYHVLDPSYSRLPPSPPGPRRIVFVPAASPSGGVDACHFSLDFLPRSPKHCSRELVDAYGSLLLLASRRRGLFPDLVVCEPISRRHIRNQDPPHRRQEVPPLPRRLPRRQPPCRRQHVQVQGDLRAL
ncbi:hypothetical protein ACP70R_049512 [Stipagrostis hirtigluma subsp. patula]